jgi:hypothetical protein
MLIISRDQNLSNIARREEKTKLAVGWLLEWRVSTVEIISAVIGVEASSTHRFFEFLLENGYVQWLNHKTFKQKKLLVLGPQAASFINAHLHNQEAEITKAKRLAKKENIGHDLQVQAVALELLSQSIEILSEYSIEGWTKVPDILSFSTKGKAVAMEIEKTRKSPLSIYHMFHQYLDMIDSGEISMINFVHSNEDDQKYYKKLFDQESWPVIDFDKKKRKANSKGEWKKIPANDPIRKHFGFFFRDPERDLKIFKMEEASKPKPYFSQSFKERRASSVITEKNNRDLEIAAAEEAERLAKVEYQRAQEEKRKEKERKRIEERNAELKIVLAQIEELQPAGLMKAASSLMSRENHELTKLKKRRDELIASA